MNLAQFAVQHWPIVVVETQTRFGSHPLDLDDDLLFYTIENVVYDVLVSDFAESSKIAQMLNINYFMTQSDRKTDEESKYPHYPDNPNKMSREDYLRKSMHEATSPEDRERKRRRLIEYRHQKRAGLLE